MVGSMMRAVTPSSASYASSDSPMVFADMSVAPSVPEPQQQQQQQVAKPVPEQQKQVDDASKKEIVPVVGEGEDFSLVPKMIEARLEEFDEEGAVRPTIINSGSLFDKKSQANLLAEQVSSVLDAEAQKVEKQKCFDLLDALTKSGALTVDASLHIVMAASHCFDKSVLNTLVQQNVNPIEAVERSTLILASVIHHKENFADLVRPSELQRVATYSSNLFIDKK